MVSNKSTEKSKVKYHFIKLKLLTFNIYSKNDSKITMMMVIEVKLNVLVKYIDFNTTNFIYLS